MILPSVSSSGVGVGFCVGVDVGCGDGEGEGVGAAVDDGDGELVGKSVGTMVPVGVSENVGVLPAAEMFGTAVGKRTSAEPQPVRKSVRLMSPAVILTVFIVFLRRASIQYLVNLQQ